MSDKPFIETDATSQKVYSNINISLLGKNVLQAIFTWDKSRILLQIYEVIRMNIGAAYFGGILSYSKVFENSALPHAVQVHAGVKQTMQSSHIHRYFMRGRTRIEERSGNEQSALEE